MFGLEVVSYLFLGGLGGGLCTVAGIAGLSIPRRFFNRDPLRVYRVLMGSSFTASALTLILAGLMLLADTGISPALRHLFLAPMPNYLTVGAWLIVVGIALCLAMAFFWNVGNMLRSAVLSKFLFAAIAIVGFGIMLYTGLFLAGMKAVPLWNTAWLPALFVSSSLSCGAVAFVALAKLCGAADFFPSYMKMVARADLAIIAFELLCAIGLVWVSASVVTEEPSAVAGVASAFSLLAGKWAWVWWGGFVLLGLLATAVFDVLMIRVEDGWPGRLWSVLGTSFCAFAGAFALRYCIVTAGTHPALSF